MHIRTWCYAVLCLSLPITLPAQKEHKYLDHALPEAWQENDSDFQQTLPVDDQWWKNFNDPTLDSLIEVAVKQNYSVLMAADRIAMAKANLRIQQGSYSPTLGLAAEIQIVIIILRRSRGEPASLYLTVALIITVICKSRGISHIDPAGLHRSVFVEAVVGSVNLILFIFSTA